MVEVAASRPWSAAPPLGLAQRHRVRVGDVLPGRGGAPRVVLAPAELHVQVDPGEGGPAGADPGALQLLQHQQLRREVPGLRPEHRDRVTRGSLARRDHDRVGHALVRGRRWSGRAGLRAGAGPASRRGPGAGRVVHHRYRGGGAAIGQHHAGRAGRASAPYGKLCPLWRVSTVSGSFCSRNAGHTASPTATPYLASASTRTSADCISPPPPPPNSPPTTPEMAITSVGRERHRPAGVGDRVEVPGQDVLAGAVDRPLRHAVR